MLEAFEKLREELHNMYAERRKVTPVSDWGGGYNSGELNAYLNASILLQAAIAREKQSANPASP